jgi:GTP-binding protein
LRYAHQGGKNPPIIVVHGNQTANVPAAYQRYLVNRFRSALRLRGTPLRIEFKSGENPYADRRNILTERQRKKRSRLMKHVRKRS